MTKKKKTNLLKKIVLTITACFIAVFSVFSLVDIPKETKQVSAATIADGDIVYNSPKIPFNFIFSPYDFSSFTYSSLVRYNGFISHNFVYQNGSNATFSFSNNYILSTNTLSRAYVSSSLQSTNGIISFSGPSLASDLSSIVFNPLLNFTCKFVYYNGLSQPSFTSYNFIFINVSYSYNPEVPFSFDVLDIYINPMSLMYGDYPSPPMSSIVYEYHPIRGNSSRLTIEYSYYNNQLFQGNDTLQRYYLRPNYESSGDGTTDPNAYQNGYDNGYTRGYIDGESSSQETFFDRGYGEGYDAGKADGFLEGESSGISQGETRGYLSGKQDGYDLGYNTALENDDKYNFTKLITAVIDVPINSFRSLFNFEILGVDMSGFFLGLLTCCIVITIVKLVI